MVIVRLMRLATQTAKKDRKSNKFFALALVAMLPLASVQHHHKKKSHHVPGCNTHACDVRIHKHEVRLHQLWIKHHPYTGYVVTGRVSTFGYLTGDGSSGITADGGDTHRACIAIRNDATLDHYFMVTVNGHTAKLLQCDWGPADSTGRSIDITGMGDEALGLSISNFPTDSYGVAKELR